MERDVILQENIALEAEGWVDHQSHGYIHNINMNDHPLMNSSKPNLKNP